MRADAGTLAITELHFGAGTVNIILAFIDIYLRITFSLQEEPRLLPSILGGIGEYVEGCKAETEEAVRRMLHAASVCCLVYYV